MSQELGDASLECSQCGYVARNSSQLHIHYRVHTGDYLLFLLIFCHVFLVLWHRAAVCKKCLVALCTVNLMKIWMYLSTVVK